MRYAYTYTIHGLQLVGSEDQGMAILTHRCQHHVSIVPELAGSELPADEPFDSSFGA